MYEKFISLSERVYVCTMDEKVVSLSKHIVLPRHCGKTKCFTIIQGLCGLNATCDAMDEDVNLAKNVSVPYVCRGLGVDIETAKLLIAYVFDANEVTISIDNNPNDKVIILMTQQENMIDKLHALGRLHKKNERLKTKQRKEKQRIQRSDMRKHCQFEREINTKRPKSMLMNRW